MTNANSFHSAVFVLILFAILYFVALAIYGIKELIRKKIEKKRNKDDMIPDEESYIERR